MRLAPCLALVGIAAACQPPRSSAPATRVPDIATSAPAPLVLEVAEGERRQRRAQTSGLSSPFIIKVDPHNGGSSSLVMGYEDIAPGNAIPPHRHLMADEIIFVHAGTGVAELGDRVVPFSTGATIFIPRDVRIAVRNTGRAPLSIAFVFSHTGFEAYLRDTSVPEGQPAPPLSAAERDTIRARHRWHTVFEGR